MKLYCGSPCRKAGSVCVALMIAIGIAASANAGVLDGNANAFAGWTGTSAYSNGSLSGTVDYAVFETADFITEFGTPGGVVLTPGELVYAYQVLNAGTDEVSQEIVATPNNSAHDIGSFLNTAGEIAPDSMLLIPTSARWTFTAPNIMTGENSHILVFSSPNIPVFSTNVTIDGGGTATGMVPSPSNTPLPEPGTFAMFALVGGLLVRRR